MITRRWQDWDHLLIGSWIFVSPWLLGHASAAGPASWSAWVLGGAVVLVAAVMMFVPRPWEEPVNVVLGVCLILSPWVLGFSHLMTATASSFVGGLLVIAFAGWVMFEDRTRRKSAREEHTPQLR